MTRVIRLQEIAQEIEDELELMETIDFIPASKASSHEKALIEALGHVRAAMDQLEGLSPPGGAA